MIATRCCCVVSSSRKRADQLPQEFEHLDAVVVVHANGDEGRAAPRAAMFDERPDEIAAVEHQLADRAGRQAGALLEPAVVRVGRVDAALPPGHPTVAGLEQMGIHSGRLVHAHVEPIQREGVLAAIAGARAALDIRRVVAVEDTERRRRPCFGQQSDQDRSQSEHSRHHSLSRRESPAENQYGRSQDRQSRRWQPTLVGRLVSQLALSHGKIAHHGEQHQTRGQEGVARFLGNRNPCQDKA